MRLVKVTYVPAQASLESVVSALRPDVVGVAVRCPARVRLDGAWLVPTATTLEIADDREGLERWPTWEDQMLAERAEKERERAERLDVEQRLAQLERKFGV